MRHSFKGASALAALCAGALAFGSVVPAQANVPGASGNPADIARVAGIDRTQTALEATTAAATIDKFFIVGHDSQVDALTLAPWNCVQANARSNNGYVIYAKGNALEARSLKVLKANPSAEVYIIGGTKAVAAGVEKQLRDLDEKAATKRPVITRVGGVDRYDTAYQVGGFIQDRCYNPGDVLDSKLVIDQLNMYIEKYNAAVNEYNAAAKGEAAARAAKEAADARVVKALEQLLKVTPKNVDVDKLEAELAAAKAHAKTVNEKAKEYIDLLESTIIDGLGIFDFSLTGNENTVTLQMFKDAAKTEKQKATIAKLTHIIETHPMKGTWKIQWTDSLKNATDKVKTIIEGLKNEQEQAARAIGKVYVKWGEVIAGMANNVAIRDEIIKAQKEVDAAEAAQAAAAKALAKAEQRLDDAIQALTFWTPYYLYAMKEMPKALKAYDAALAKAYKGSVAPIFVSTGVNFADALAAGPAAAKQKGVVLLTEGEKVPALTAKALNLSKALSVAIGGPAARAMKATHSQAARSLTGKDRYHTAVLVAKRYFADGTVAGSADGLYVLASGEVAADAVVAGAYLTSQANYGGILLTKANSLPKVTADFLSFGTTGANQTKPYIGAVAVFGGKKAISPAVFSAAVEAAHMQ